MKPDVKRRLQGAWIAPISVIADQVSKRLFASAPQSVRNSGMAFSLLNGQNGLLTVVTTLTLLMLTVWLIAKPRSVEPLARFGLWMVVGGGIGNLVDRVRFGEVIDFIELPRVRFAIFNIADVFVVAGVCLAALSILTGGLTHDGNDRGNGDDS